MMVRQRLFEKAVRLLREDIETMLDDIHADAVLAGLDQDQQAAVMQPAYAKADALQTRWIGKLRAICGVTIQ